MSLLLYEIGRSRELVETKITSDYSLRVCTAHRHYKQNLDKLVLKLLGKLI